MALATNTPAFGVTLHPTCLPFNIPIIQSFGLYHPNNQLH